MKKSGLMLCALLAFASPVFLEAANEPDAATATLHADTVEKTPSVAKLLSKAEAGDAASQLELGDKYVWGDEGIPADPAQSLLWWEKAAKQGNAKALLRLAEQAERGQRRRGDSSTNKASELYLKAAETGDAEAQWTLAGRYENGSNGDRDIALALPWVRKAAEQGHASAQLWLGRAYAYGNAALTRDKKLSREWFTKASAQGECNATFAVASAYLEEKDTANYLVWLNKAADQGSPNAADRLGDIFRMGESGQQLDYARAYANYLWAERFGFEQVSGRKRTAVAELLTSEQKLAAQVLVAEFAKNRPSPSRGRGR